MKAFPGILEAKESPCMAVLKRKTDGSLSRITLIELNAEGLLDVESVKVLLKESVQLYKTALDKDIKFIGEFEKKQEMVRMLQSNPMAAQLNQMQQMFQAYEQQARDPVRQEYEKQEELRKKQQIERDRK